jgi:hypothetical protein
MSYLLAILINFMVLGVPPAVPDALLHVTIEWDGDYDGQWEGVGPGVVVGVGKAGSETYSLTDANSQVHYRVPFGVWFARAFPPQTRPFFVWQCAGHIDVNDEQELLIVTCFERFIVRFPFLIH